MQVKLQEFIQREDCWDLRRLERALWTYAVLRKHLTDQEWKQFIDVQPEPSNTGA
jgi:ParB-like chromosome segregation protein Spo0J